MKPEDKNTQGKILSSAKQEFLQKGFLNASLRNIVKNAGVTTGAFYRYYDSKEALFSALVGEQAEYVLALFNNTLDDFEKLPGDMQTQQMINISNNCIAELMDYIYDNYDAFKLLIEHSEGTSYILNDTAVEYINEIEVIKTFGKAQNSYAPIIILDEATAYTDPENEAVIQSYVAKLVQGKTLIVIAHRLSTIVDADKIFVIDSGRVAEEGTHTNLLETGENCTAGQT